MPMMEEMKAQGNWLFRWRSYLPFVAVGLLLAGLEYYAYPFGSHRLDQAWELFCLAISFIGLAVRVATVGFAPRKTSGRNTKRQVAQVLNTTGLYSLVRNPLYLGNFVIGFGLALFLHVWWVPVIYTLVFVIYYERIIFAEESFLREKFGRQYVDWAKKTNLFVPRVSQWTAPDQRFNVRQVLRREHQTLFGIVMAFYVVEQISELHLGVPVFGDIMWNAIAVTAVAFFVVVRLLRRFTTVLKGREPRKTNQPIEMHQ